MAIIFSVSKLMLKRMSNINKLSHILVSISRQRQRFGISLKSIFSASSAYMTVSMMKDKNTVCLDSSVDFKTQPLCVNAELCRIKLYFSPLALASQTESGQNVKCQCVFWPYIKVCISNRQNRAFNVCFCS